jgi:hypothetical protein
VAPPTVYKVSNLLHRIFPSFKLTDVAVIRAHDCASGNVDVDAFVSTEKEKEGLEVAEENLFKTVAYSYTFAKLFEMFPKTRARSDAMIDISDFNKVCAMLHVKLDPAAATDAFESMESNDGAGNVLLAEVAAWLGQKQYIDLNRAGPAATATNAGGRDSKKLIDGMAASLADPKRMWEAWTAVIRTGDAKQCTTAQLSEWLRENCKEIYDEQMFRSAVEMGCDREDGRSTLTKSIPSECFVNVITSFTAIVSAGFLTGIDEHSKVSPANFSGHIDLLLPSLQVAPSETGALYQDLVQSSSTGSSLFGDDVFRWYAGQRLKEGSTDVARADFLRRLGGSDVSVSAAIAEVQTEIIGIATDPLKLADLWARGHPDRDGLGIDTFAGLMMSEFSIFRDPRLQLDAENPLLPTVFATAAARDNLISKDDFGTALSRTILFTALRCAARSAESESGYVEPVTLEAFRKVCQVLDMAQMDVADEYRALQADAKATPVIGNVCEWYVDHSLPILDIDRAASAFAAT